MWVFSFPNPVNEKAARTVAAGVVAMCIAALVLQEGWVLIPLAFGFWVRMASGPRFSPLGQLATRVVAPRLPGQPRMVPGPPKRFAQAIGVVFSSTAIVLWFGFGLTTATWVMVALLATAAFLESALGLCLGCQIFGVLMRAGVIPEEVCRSCSDISLRHPQLSPPRTA
jgi:hypothetical protein